MQINQIKTCSVCGGEKPLSEFYKDTRWNPPRLRAACKRCTNIGTRLWQQMNKGKVCSYTEKWRAKNPECVKAYTKEHYKENPMKVMDASRRWRKKYPEEYRYSTRQSHLKLKYGITLEGFDSMLKSQNGSCKICGSIPNPNAKRRQHRVLHVDHDHNTGIIRSLLCWKCNTMIGIANEDTDILRFAADYIDGFKKTREVV